MRKYIIAGAAVLAVVLAGCGDSGNPAGSGDEWTVQGTIYCDSIPDGTHCYVELLSEGENPGEYEVEYFEGASLFNNGEAVYSMAGVEEEAYFFYVIIDLNDNINPDDPSPDAADLVSSDVDEYDIVQDTTINYFGGWEYYSGGGGGGSGWYPMEVGDCWSFDLDGWMELGPGYTYDISGSFEDLAVGIQQHVSGFDVIEIWETSVVVYTLEGGGGSFTDSMTVVWYLHVTDELAEAYDDLSDPVSEVFLQFPLVVGNSWGNPDETFTVLSLSEFVDVPAGSFSDCALVEMVLSGAASGIDSWYAEDTGEVQIYEGSEVGELWACRVPVDSPRLSPCGVVQLHHESPPSIGYILERVRALPAGDAR